MSAFPQPFASCVSHWQATNRGAETLYLHNAEVAPPAEADIVIVGGGTMGASLAYFLTRKGAEGEGKKIVLVEAKDVASGASGRNGGHVGPYGSSGFYALKQPSPAGAGLDDKEAIHVIQAERDNLDLIESVIHDNKIAEEVEWWRGELCEVHETTTRDDIRRAQFLEWQALRSKYYPQPHDMTFISSPTEARRISRMHTANSILLRPAGSVHSHKLCTALMRLALESEWAEFELFSYTVVEEIVSVEGVEGKSEARSQTKNKDDYKWIVRTSKGEIKCKKVVLCTNAHTQNFFPPGDPLHDHIAPCFAQCSLITPTATYSGKQALSYTYNMEGGFYLVQTPMGGIVLGGGDSTLVADGKLRAGWNVGKTDDSFVLKEMERLHADYCASHFSDWGTEAYGEGLTRTWSGILSRVKDTLPLVGSVPGKEGMFMAAGFHGHGQSRIFSTARALASQLQTGSYNDALLPRSFEITMERLERCAKIPHGADDGEDLTDRAALSLGARIAAEFVPKPVAAVPVGARRAIARTEGDSVPSARQVLLNDKVHTAELSEKGGQPVFVPKDTAKTGFRCCIQ